MLVAEEPLANTSPPRAQAVGMMTLTTKVNAAELQETYDLALFDNLCELTEEIVEVEVNAEDTDAANDPPVGTEKQLEADAPKKM